MSHFCCAIIYDDENDIDMFLEPYSENDETYFKFEPLEEEKLNKIKLEFEEEKESFKCYKDFDDYMKNYFGYKYDEETNKYGYFYNPDALYDYYSIGTRDDEVIWKKEDNYKVSNVDFYTEDLAENAKNAAEFWEDFVENENDDRKSWYKREYYIERYKTKENYIKEHSQPYTPYCFFDPNGVLHAPGRVGWFGCSDETYESWANYYEEWKDALEKYSDFYITFCDMHI